MAKSAHRDRNSAAAAAGSSSDGLTRSGEFAQPVPILSPGTILARRYAILELLGEGGMGAVYKAEDRELERLVALKVIRPELASNPSALQRFKQELVLARKVSHKNVVRIYDLGEDDGLRFITMEYVAGEDLRSLLRRRGKLPPEEAVSIFQQICRALDAAHSEEVIHRDLKPGNVMRDAHGRVVVMDFGLARSVEASGLTQTGALVGTLEYMAPEQALGQPADAASDLYAAGLILYEMLIGRPVFPNESGVASLLRRTRERPTPPAAADKNISSALSEVVTRCLEPDRLRRYKSAAEVLADLECSGAPETRLLTASLSSLQVLPRRPRLGTGAVLAASLLIAAAIVFAALLIKTRWMGKPAAHPPVSVLVADFSNQTQDPVFDGTLEPALTVALEGAPFINSFNRGQAHKLAAKLQPGATALDAHLARLVATREGIAVVISGAVERDGENYRVSLEADDAVTGKPVLKQANTASKKDVLTATGKLAASVRKALGDTTPESAQLAAAETFSAASLEAAHKYATAQELLWAGKNDDAIQQYLEAIKLDPNFGRAYSGLAAIYHNFGQQQEAEQYYKLALSKIDRMSEREKYRTRGAYYAIIREPDKAIEELEQLVHKYPSDSAGFANLALAYFYKRDMAHALEDGRHAVELSPNNVLQRNNLGLYAMYAGDFDTAIREQQRVLELNPSFEMAYVGMALAQMGQGQPEDAAESYRKLAKVSARGASLAAFGLADIALTQGDAAAAIALLQPAVTADLNEKKSVAAAVKLVALAQAHIYNGKAQEALADVSQALAASQDDSILFWSARTYLDAEKPAKARSLAQQLRKKLSADAQSYGRLIVGEALLREDKAQEALKMFQEAKNNADTWMGRFDSAIAYLRIGAYAEADSELETCLKRRGEAAAVFLDDVPTFRVLPPVYYFLGRAQQGLNSPAATDSYKTFLAVRNRAERDPQVVDARRRLSSH